MFGHILHTFEPSNRDGLLLFFLWTLWAARSVVHKSTGLFLVLTQIEGADPGRTPRPRMQPERDFLQANARKAK